MASESPPDRPGVLHPGDLLSIAQVLGLLPISKAGVYQLIAEGTLPALRVRTLGSRRGRVLVRRSALEAFVAGLETPVAPRVGKVPVKVDVDSLRRRVLERAG